MGRSRAESSSSRATTSRATRDTKPEPPTRTGRAAPARPREAARARATARPDARLVARRRYHHGDLPRALLEAARRLLAEGGTDALTLRAAASLVGVNHRAVYRHYEDKRALLAALAGDGFRALDRRVARALARLPEEATAERLLAIAVCYLRFAQTETAIFRVMFGPRLNEDDRFPELEVVLAAALARVVAEMERGVARGRLAPGKARDRAIALWSLAHGYADLVLQKRIRVRSAAVARRYLAAVFAPFLAGLRKQR